MMVDSSVPARKLEISANRRDATLVCTPALSAGRAVIESSTGGGAEVHLMVTAWK
jgi:hypothetical protein